MTEVLAAGRWTTNAEMIEDVVRLNYIQPTDRVLDMTWGSGVWWKTYRHRGPFVAICNDPVRPGSDILKMPAPAENVVAVTADFRALPDTELFAPGSYRVVVLDPPYVSKGGRDTSTIPRFLAAYGLRDAASSPRALHAYNVGALREAIRMTAPGGYILVKCMDYISSGELQLATHWMLNDALDLGLKCVERWAHVGNPGPQPRTNLDGSERRQVHGRYNYSTLFIFQKPRRPRAQVL